MTIAYQKPLYGFRFAEIQRGDTLQAIAAREMGDAARWHDLIVYNNLRPPYITDNTASTAAGVLRAGALIRLPAPVPVVTTTTEADRVFERDVELRLGRLEPDESGDFAVISGVANLGQALRHRVETERGELVFHTDYGSLVRRLIGAINGPTASLLAAEYAKSAVQGDARVKRVTKATAEVIGDTINVSVELEPIVGRAIRLDATP